MDLIFRAFGRHIAKRMAANAYRPRNFDGLTFAFAGSDGLTYYTWADVGDLPWIRAQKVGQLLAWADAGISRKTMDELTGELDRVLTDEVLPASEAKARARAVAKAVHLSRELLARGRDIIPEDIYHELAAAMIVGEDEEPTKLDPVRHTQKATMLKEAGKAGAPVFTSIPCFAATIGSALTTAAAYAQLLTNWTKEQQRRQAVLGSITSADTWQT